MEVTDAEWGEMRLTMQQNILFRWVPTEYIEPFYQRLVAAGIGTADAMTLGDVVSDDIGSSG